MGAYESGLAGIRTQGLCLAKAALYQLSYKPQLVLLNVNFASPGHFSAYRDT
jgi:hypothetical protein